MCGSSGWPSGKEHTHVSPPSFQMGPTHHPHFLPAYSMKPHSVQTRLMPSLHISQVGSWPRRWYSSLMWFSRLALVYLHSHALVYLHMTTEKPYGDTYTNDILRLTSAQETAAGQFAAQTLYLREETAGRRISSTPPELRNRLAEEAAQEWIRLAGEIEALNAAEYRKTRG